MPIQQQEFICGLSQEVTIAVLPRLTMEELMFELNRRIQNLDKENSIKDRLVSILRDVMLEEYHQLERRSHVSFPGETAIFGQNHGTATMQENILITYAETMLSETSSPVTSQQSSGLDIVIKKERDTSREVLMHTEPKDFDLDTDQIQTTVSEQDRLCNTPGPGSQTFPSFKTSLTQMNVTADSLIKEEDIDMSDEDAACRARHDELDIDTSTFSMQVLDTLNSMNTSYSETPVESKTTREEEPSASCYLPPDNGDLHLKMECHVSQDDQNRQISQPSNPDHTEHYTDVRDTGITNNGHEQSRKDSSEETPLAPSDQDCESMASLHPDNGSQIGSKRHMCELKTSFVNSTSKRRKRQKPFMCDECGYRARHKYRLVAHMRTHTGEKPFKCNQCNFKTSHKKCLVQHMKRHTDAEPYSCELCDYQAYQKSHMERHMMCHSGVKSFKCEECNYRTTHKGDLIKHIRRHTGERPYSCQVCDYKAKERGKLNRHMRLKHPHDCQKSKPAK
ncbi:zinc finger protein with KRAB and SCAN domains 8-like [Branchiostoma floridae]|uniref:Zinc finger protein with KRAB and SCAN domains 8-like n=1 Tax=Branchiostoma floridae TaxID=7739 RepID=A0A9J7MEJ4_BRAFL|nr:zinc finger protein with KRAB and SCAN domains 8-like [Branchiostoma floridae]